MTDIVWEEPTPPVGTKTDWKAALAPLRENPGKWARFDDVSVGSANAIRYGGAAGCKGGEFEVKRRGVGKHHPHRCTLYVRYVGNGNGATA